MIYKQIHISIVQDDSSTQTMYKYSMGNILDLTILSKVEDDVEHLSKNQVNLALIDLSLEVEEDGLTLIHYMKNDTVLQSIPIATVIAHTITQDRQNATEAGCVSS